ncbi:amidohydrolase [Adhaeretor mobilis]|nr:amidohydrolase [Adhaeretor mobilis]
MQRLDSALTHVWMVRTFIKHSEEAEEDDELRDVQRTLYDYLLSLGTAWKEQDGDAYVRQAKKKLTKLQAATVDFAEIQPEISTHMNFQMAVRSLQTAVEEVARLLETSKQQ